ncbi:low-density lipoprotein receptor-related protein 8-like [Scylla paramamosain]|uniref:low-density lipoprotein receptor-related protein 8-like n=1 Tax=Scylla paramamosain TaxID=85552 RepID=UPI003083CD7B
MAKWLLVTVFVSAALAFAAPQDGEDKDVLQGNLKYEHEDEKPMPQSKAERNLFTLPQSTAFPASPSRRPLWAPSTSHGGSGTDGKKWFLQHAANIIGANMSARPTDCGSDDVYLCGSDVICLPQVCDGVADCPNWEDETDCECLGDSFVCDSVVCIDSSMVCDGAKDCVDGTDEEQCDSTITTPSTTATQNTTSPGAPTTTTTTTITTTTTTTTTTRPSCRNGVRPRLCKDRKTYACFCDGVVECPRGEDEYRCKPEGCQPGQWRCRCDGTCIPQHAVCNRCKDCPDGSDERGCVPGTGWWRCRRGGWIRMWQRCDGRRDCRDGSDEWLCPQKHHCHGTHHWLSSLSRRSRLKHLLDLFDDDDVYRDSEEDSGEDWND